ncbi:transposase [Desulfoglaeba alkanexedens]|uniref:Transposase n=1 Tax=Desulfoglaeba alkanexedens ALDC TaxID=980445 RepID=A0A4P8L562_9BACT|nr:transposase [Desulfoglaeba alkanexedens]QCQ23166.1 transposase [Desulfoglaeba alkanexedens ALDC]
MNPIAEASQKIIERLSWCTASRDQAGIASDLAEREEISEVYGLGEAGLFDEFFYFLEELGIMKLFMGLDPNRNQRSSNIKFPAVILIYLMRIVAGLRFFWHINPVILSSQSLMRLVGFNGREVREGTSARGRKKPVAEPCDDSDPSRDDPRPTPIRGPYCPDSIAAYIQAIAASALERLFNGVVTILAAHSFFPKKIHALMDSSEIQSTERCRGCGKVSKEKAPELRRRKKRIRKVLETVFGFKIWVVWDPASRLPIALRFATIEVSDVDFAGEVVQQAVTNLADHATIVSLAMDRGFIDGKFLWWLHDTMHITFYIPAKTNMDVYADAVSLTAGGIRETREKARSVGKGSNKTTVVDHWDVVGIEALTSAGFYGELGSGSHQNRKDFTANPLNAVVVLDDPFKRNNPDSDTLVILTNGSVQKPLEVYDAYDARSEIENALFREAKQAWFIERPARNNADAFRSHVYLTVLMMALTAAFQTWMDQQDKLAQKGQETGIRKFREKVRQENGNKLIVFEGDRYAIFDAYEVFILCGTNVRMPTGVPESISKRDILLKYGALRE